MLKVIAAAAAVLVFGSSVTVANATTVNFGYLNGSTQVADGSFTYADGLTGVLHYSDLTAFSLHFARMNDTYNLAFASANPSFQYFAFDTSTDTFVRSVIGGFPESLGAINASFTAGFFANPDARIIRDYSDNANPSEQPYTVLEFSAASVPGPIVGAGASSFAFAALFLAWFLRRRAPQTV